VSNNCRQRCARIWAASTIEEEDVQGGIRDEGLGTGGALCCGEPERSVFGSHDAIKWRRQHAPARESSGQRRQTNWEGRERAWRGHGGAELHQEADGGLAEIGEAAEHPDLSVAGDGRRRKMTTMVLI
jgi:hypothetical protein